MKTWIKRSLIGVGTAAVLLGLAACGGNHRHGGWSDERIAEMRGPALARVASKLSLDAPQKAALETLANEMLAQRQALRGAAPGAEPRAQIKALIASEKFDRAGARQLLDQKTNAVQTQAPKVLDAMANFYDGLSVQQQTQVRDMLNQRGRGRW